MPRKERFKTDYPGVFFTLNTGTDGKPEKVFYIFYRKGGRQIEEKAGRQRRDDMTPARAAALRALRMDNKVPTNQEKRDAERAVKEAEANRWTVKRLWEAYKEQKTGFKSLRQDEYRFTKHLAKFADMEPRQIAPLDVDRVRVTMHKSGLKPQSIKNVLALLKRIVFFGVKRGLCPGLSFQIELPRVDNLKTEFLTPEQLQSLFAALDEDPNIQGSNILRMALFTGMRFSEICKLTWDDVDFGRGFLFVRDPKEKRSKALPMNDLARVLLEDHPRTEGSEFVFPGADGNMRVTNRHTAARIRERAGLPKDFRYHHGLRHTLASYMANSGEVDSYVGHKALGHADQKMWARYAHLQDQTLRDAVQVPAEVFKRILAKEDKAGKVVNLRDGRE
ncbi:MAG: tyrosine-type recombinase/integrase [Thermodesulfobacteriota bacterium]